VDLVLFGIQGSGKGTQAKRLAQEYGYHIFETGAALREIAMDDSDLGRSVKSTIDAGDHVSADLVIDVLRTFVQSSQNEIRLIFDGIPRNLDQMKPFDDVIQKAGRSIQCIEFHVNQEAAIQRILKRSEMENRVDDASEVSIRRRMQLFHEKTRPVIDAYRMRNIMIDIDSDGSIDDVYEKLKKACILP
jgi:adenylate kinase